MPGGLSVTPPKVVFPLPLRSPHFQVAGVGGGATPWKKIKELSRTLALDGPDGGEAENGL